MDSADMKGTLRDVVAKLKARREGLKKALEQTETEIRAVETTMNLLTQNGSKPSHLTEIFAEKPYDFKGKTQKESLIEIAKRNDGIVRVSEGKRILSAAGKLKKGRNSWGSIYTTLNRSKEFEKAGPGEFRLIPAQVNVGASDALSYSDSVSKALEGAR
jgi:hypothetical protein